MIKGVRRFHGSTLDKEHKNHSKEPQQIFCGYLLASLCYTISYGHIGVVWLRGKTVKPQIGSQTFHDLRYFYDTDLDCYRMYQMKEQI